MKGKLFFLVLVGMLALVSIALAEARSAEPDVAIDLPETTILSGGHFRLTSATLRDTQGSFWLENDPSSSNEATRQSQVATLTGGRFRLTSLTLGNDQQEPDLASGGGYHLKGLANPPFARPQLTGNGCCCLYLPCVQR
jgi:hypothetical protein